MLSGKEEAVSLLFSAFFSQHLALSTREGRYTFCCTFPPVGGASRDARDRYRGWTLSTTAPCEARTFLPPLFGVLSAEKKEGRSEPTFFSALSTPNTDRGDRPADRRTHWHRSPRPRPKEGTPEVSDRFPAKRHFAPDDKMTAWRPLSSTGPNTPPPEFAGGAVTVGNFDGVHRGHRALVAAARRLADDVAGRRSWSRSTRRRIRCCTPGRNARRSPPSRSGRNCCTRAGADHVVVLRTEPRVARAQPGSVLRGRASCGSSARRRSSKATTSASAAAAPGRTPRSARCAKPPGSAFAEVPQFALGGEPVSSSRVRAALVSGRRRARGGAAGPAVPDHGHRRDRGEARPHHRLPHREPRRRAHRAARQRRVRGARDGRWRDAPGVPRTSARTRRSARTRARSRFT